MQNQQSSMQHQFNVVINNGASVNNQAPSRSIVQNNIFNNNPNNLTQNVANGRAFVHPSQFHNLN